MKVLILGHKGMLGFVVHQYFKDQNIECITTDYRWPSKEFKNVVENFKGDVIINCIAITVPDKDKININFELPIYLDTNTSCKIVHPGTDNENEMGLYAASKSKASLWILNEGKNTKIIRSSIIGPELTPKPYLFEYIKKSKEISLSNYALWNGCTTLYWAKFSLDLLNNWNGFEKDTIIGSDCLSKVQLAYFIKDIFNLDITIKPTQEKAFNRCLKQNNYSIPIQEQLIDLKNFIYIYNQNNTK